jgi:hypothetical protein
MNPQIKKQRRDERLNRERRRAVRREVESLRDEQARLKREAAERREGKA